MTIPVVDSPVRTDAQFNGMSNENPVYVHRHLRIFLVFQFPQDCMHIVCLSVKRQLIWLWMKSPVAHLNRIGAHSIEMISSTLLTFSWFLP